MNPEEKYAAAWRGFRQRLVAARLLGLAAVVSFFFPLSKTKVFNEFLFLAAVLVFVWFMSFRCPRCGKLFLVDWVLDPRMKQCLHCGLPRYAEPQ